MLLFPEEEHDKIRAGALTVTFRDWDKIRVEEGKEYKSFNLGFVRVEEVGYIDIKKITDEDLSAAGFMDMEDFKAVFRKRNPGFNFGSGRVIRIRFSYLGSDNRSASRVKPNEKELIKIMERLVEIDVLSTLDIKCDDVLGSLDRKEAKNSAVLAKQFGIELQDIRQRMTQLKKEGLVDLRRDGYTITIRGKAYLESKI